MSAVSAHSVATPAPSPITAWPVAPRRVVCPMTNRSQRPVSSSPRSSRVPVRRPQTDPTIIRVMETLNTVNPPTVWRSGAGPNNAVVALLAPKAVARPSRSAGVL